MKAKAYNLIILIVIACSSLVAVQVRADSTSSREYQVKAAFLYNFINFIDWPEENINTDKKNPIVIGIIGKNPFGNAFEPIKDKEVKDRKVTVKQFENLEELKKTIENSTAAQQCHLLYISSSEKENLKKILDLIKDKSILTVGDTEHFLESEGIINFLMEDNKVCFEINKTAAERAKLKIRSKLLRLAKRVIPE